MKILSRLYRKLIFPLIYWGLPERVHFKEVVQNFRADLGQLMRDFNRDLRAAYWKIPRDLIDNKHSSAPAAYLGAFNSVLRDWPKLLEREFSHKILMLACPCAQEERAALHVLVSEFSDRAKENFQRTYRSWYASHNLEPPDDSAVPKRLEDALKDFQFETGDRIDRAVARYIRVEQMHNILEWRQHRVGFVSGVASSLLVALLFFLLTR